MKHSLQKQLFLFLLSLSMLTISYVNGANPPGSLPAEVPATPTPLPEMLPGYEGAVLKMIVTFIALLVGIFFTVWILKKLSRGHFNQLNANRAIKILEKRPLSPKTMLYLVELGNKQTLIAESQLEVKSLATLNLISEEDTAESFQNQE